MNEHQRILIALGRLGKFLRLYGNADSHTDQWSQKLEETISLAKHKNGWFTKDNVQFAFQSWGNVLTEEAIFDWAGHYDLKKNRPKTVAIIMAGNIPLVGLHDLFSALITGNKVLARLSSNDNVLLYFIKDYLIFIEPSLHDKIIFSDGRLLGFDAVIATGSNNTARYFEYYFGKVPNIIRRNRNSIAVLTGKESESQLKALGEDIFRYYGLGCRSVSKIFVPEGYDFDILFTSLYHYHPIVQQNKYANNYDYNKAVYLMSEFKVLDNGFLILKEDESYDSPIASLFYERYTTLEALKDHLKKDKHLLQCVVGKGIASYEIDFGETQSPTLTDYADEVDTVDFLLKN